MQLLVSLIWEDNEMELMVKCKRSFGIILSVIMIGKS